MAIARGPARTSSWLIYVSLNAHLSTIACGQPVGILHNCIGWIDQHCSQNISSWCPVRDIGCISVDYDGRLGVFHCGLSWLAVLDENLYQG